MKMHVPTLCDWFSSSASASDSDNHRAELNQMLRRWISHLRQFLLYNRLVCKVVTPFTTSVVNTQNKTTRNCKYQFKVILCLVWFVGRSKVDLSSATVSFSKGVLVFVADGLSVITPQVIRLNNVWLKPPPPLLPKTKRKEKKHCSLFPSQNSKKKRLNFKNKAGNLATRIPI